MMDEDKDIKIPTIDAGMSLRDFFAGCALVADHLTFAILTTQHELGKEPPWPEPDELAGRAYFLADAMLAAREEKSDD